MTKTEFYRLRKKAGLTQAQVANEFDVTIRTIKNIERGEREGNKPKRFFILALKKLLTG
ncbi:helix-turn-helix domain [Caudoviricetes sp.]|nr:helix-turn-helix domain [Caudoviricetes sp.]